MSAYSRLATSLQRLAQANHTYTENLANQRVRNGIALGFIDIDNEGEAVARVTFPMLFLERPVFTFGLELGENSALEHGYFPIVSACVASWQMRSEGNNTMFAGAIVGVLATGITGKASVHYCFQARSYTTPTVGTGSVGETL